jgi:Aminoglycoside-2''-adenylyltransferase
MTIRSRTPVSMSDGSNAGEWLSTHPREAMDWLSSLTVPWWVAGGWALDLHIGTQSRPHGDLDIGLLRRDFLVLAHVLASWEIFEAKDGILTRLPDGALPRVDVNSLWCRRKQAKSWVLEVMLDDSAGEDWVFRRRPEIRRPLVEVVRRDARGIPYLAPETQLLYKARHQRERDQGDFDRVQPHLDQQARQWLHDALVRSEPGHVWIAALSSTRLNAVHPF